MTEERGDKEKIKREPQSRETKIMIELREKIFFSGYMRT